MFSNFPFLVKSFFFFFTSFFIRRKYDVVFYYPQHFNRGMVQENSFFTPLINTSKKNNLRYILIEEPDYNSNSKRNKDAVYFDFIFVIILVLRKLFSTEMDAITKDHKIGRFLSNTFFLNIKFMNVITISQSMVSVFRGLNKDCNIYDVQHGIIHNNKPNYILHNKAEPNLVDNNVSLLLSGKSFQKLLIDNEALNYFKEHTFVLGSGDNNLEKVHHSFNNNVLVTLQFVHDHSEVENIGLLDKLTLFLIENPNVKFHLKHHPRFNNEVDLSVVMNLNNVIIAPIHLDECFKLCSLHATAYSTSVFEAAQHGIPSVIINPLKQFNFFKTDFIYPLNYGISDFMDITVYQKSTEIVKVWAKEYYSPYNELTFLNLLK
mgnify:FL=1|jgi:hypothetical protein|tara:strand:- start:827 stop:1954 length:1128 start_codon:yes stop_codon:yes gene_type:complete